MSQNSHPNNVPGSKQGTPDSLAAPGRVGAGGTFQLWLFAEIARLRDKVANPCASMTPDQDSEDYLKALSAFGVYQRFESEQSA